jgi:hypothetical protein
VSGLEGSWKDKVAFIRKGTQDPGGIDLMEKLAIDGFPYVIVLDREGNEVTRVEGVMSADEINDVLKKATAGPAAQRPAAKTGSPR